MKLPQYVPGHRERAMRSVALLSAIALCVGLLMLATLIGVMQGIADDGHARRHAEAQLARLTWMCAAPGASLSADCATAFPRAPSHHVGDPNPLVTLSLSQ